MAAPDSVSTGDRVKYGQEIYYFQPHGSSCYLYRRKEDVSQTAKALFSPRHRCIIPLTRAELDALDGKLPRTTKRNLLHPLTLDDSETDDAESFISRLDDAIRRVDT